jgi:hypothetical protein
VLATVGAIALFGSAVSSAAPAYTLIGAATVASESVTLVSNTADVPTTNDASAVSFTDTGVTTFGSLMNLGADFNVTDDDCAGGSPRFTLAIGGKNLFVNLGPVPSFTGCTANTWTSTGNLIESTETRFDLSQFGGPFYGTYAEALALLGGQTVTNITLVADSGWAFADGEQTVLVDNVAINGTTFTFAAPATATPTATATSTAVATATPSATAVPTTTATPVATATPSATAVPGGQPSDKDDCKKGGWQTFSNPSYKNQGQCVSSVNHRD